LMGLRRRLPFMRGNFVILTVRMVVGQICRNMVFPYASLLVLAVGGSTSQVGVVNSVMPLAGLLVYPVAGYLTDRRGRVRLMALAGYLSAFTMLIFVFAPSWEWIALASLLQGFAVLEFPPSSAILAESLEPRYRGVGVATMTTLANLFAVASPIIAGVITESLGNDAGVRVLYGIYMFSFIINTLMLRYLSGAEPDGDPGELPSVTAILREVYGGLPDLIRGMSREVKALSVVTALAFISNALTAPFWVVYATDVVGVSNVDWGLILFIESIIKIGLTIPAGMVADRYGRARTLFAAVLISLVSLPSIVLATGFIHVLLVRVGAALAVALYVPSSAALMADLVPREKRGRVMSAVGRGSVMVGATGGGTGGPGMGYLYTVFVVAGSVLGGVLYSVDPSYPWLGVLAACVAQMAFVALFIRDPKEREH
jgi:MFS family permease